MAIPQLGSLARSAAYIPVRTSAAPPTFRAPSWDAIDRRGDDRSDSPAAGRKVVGFRIEMVNMIAITSGSSYSAPRVLGLSLRRARAALVRDCAGTSQLSVGVCAYHISAHQLEGARHEVAVEHDEPRQSSRTRRISFAGRRFPAPSPASQSRLSAVLSIASRTYLDAQHFPRSPIGGVLTRTVSARHERARRGIGVSLS